ncbi:unnamed protein product [Parascedosporium putredinis]|uniref:U6 snRNA phosphodiesterase 1 n=1 Tax=Parascedosporium putredinis TaxID=1442378 RepID=A0A9P1MFD2_9PEZI|nr:unnamed protein product [Parascedosporium putredinis]CAI8002155.1 unnamed protein product [Parascedosporium putredinis]
MPPKPSLPPLPANFHDLYASTVRQSTVDDPSLHQGRKRLNPHDGFLDSITTAVHAASIGPFYIEPYTLKFFRSPDSDRTFLVLGVRPRVAVVDCLSRSQKPLTTLLRKCNAAAQSLHLPLLYQKPGGSGPDENAFHISLAWTLDHVPDADRVLGRDDRHPETPLDRIKEWALEVSGVKVKIGNVVTHVGLDKNGGMSKKALFDW